jgi:uncharacterized protein (TIGR03435 family)
VKQFIYLVLAVPAIWVVNAQVPSGQAEFEVASVKRVDQCGGRNSLDPGSVTFRGVPLKGVLREAFGVKMEQIEGPSWLETDCFDISAKLPSKASTAQLPSMLQSLLADRFKLQAHEEDRPRSGFALTVDKNGPKIKEDDPATNFLGTSGRPGLTMYGVKAHGALKGIMTMATLASNLSKEGYGQVEDYTGLKGKYDIDLTWTREMSPVPRAGDATAAAGTAPGTDLPAPEGSSLFTAVREMLGLKLERRTVQVRFLVVDHAERIPTGN